MNRTVIEWTDRTWNPVVGCCLLCLYCYAMRQAKRHRPLCKKCYVFKPHLHPERLEQPCLVRKRLLIFVCSMAELFGPWVPPEWIEAVLGVTRRCPQHTFQFLTKCPARLREIAFGENCWVGTSIDRRENLWRLEDLGKAKSAVRFVSFEPLLGDMGDLDLHGLDWVIIGAQTGPGAVRPVREWVQGILDKARDAGVPVFMKDNVRWPEVVREWPRGFQGR